MEEMIKRKPLIIGIGIALICYFISGEVLSFAPFLFAGIAIGYMIGTDIKIGAINGALLGIISSLVIIVMVAVVIFTQVYSLQAVALLGTRFVVYFVVGVVTAVMGGVLGSLVRKEVEKS